MARGIGIPVTCWRCGGQVVAGYDDGEMVYSCVDEGVVGDRDAIIGAVPQ